MKRKKLLARLNDMLSTGVTDEQHDVSRLHDILKALKQKQRSLEEKLEDANGDHERRKISKQIEVIRLQREKGVEVYKSIKSARQ